MLLFLFRLVLLAATIFVVYRLVQRFALGGGGRSGFKCRNCQHCKTLFDDGVLCRYGSKEVFKNAVHIENCQDYTRS